MVCLSPKNGLSHQQENPGAQYLMIQLKSPRLSIPAEAGIQSFQELLDPRWSLSQVFAFKKRKNLIR
jgi:hypothetical protein